MKGIIKWLSGADVRGTDYTEAGKCFLDWWKCLNWGGNSINIHLSKSLNLTLQMHFIVCKL